MSHKDHEEQWYEEAESVDVSEAQMRKYGEGLDSEPELDAVEADEISEDEEIRRIAKQIRRARFKSTKFSPVRFLLMLGVFFLAPWQIWGDRDDIAYYFKSETPQDLGDGMSYRRPGFNEVFEPKPQDFPDNSYVKIWGYPVRMMGIETNEGILKRHQRKVLYQVNGSTVFVQEPIEGSQFVSFFSQMGAAFNAENVIDYIEVDGRLRRFDADRDGIYLPLRQHLAKRYNMQFCSDLTKAQRLRGESLLGKGGLSLLIDDGHSAQTSESHTTASLLKARAATANRVFAIGNDNVLLHSNDGGQNWEREKLDTHKKILSFALDKEAKSGVFVGEDGYIARGTAPFGVMQSINNSSNQDVLDVAVIDEQHMAAVGRESLAVYSEDGGVTWKNAEFFDPPDFRALMADEGEDELLLVGSDSQILVRKYAPSDGEESQWQREVSPANCDYRSLTTHRTRDGKTLGIVATGTGHTLAYRDAKSKIWRLLELDNCPGIELNDSINASVFDDTGKIWVGVGNNGSILRSENFLEQPVQAIAGKNKGFTLSLALAMGEDLTSALARVYGNYSRRHLNSVRWHNGVFYTVGAAATFMRSEDNGFTWEKLQLPSVSADLHDILFVDVNTAYIAGAGGLLLKSTDGGESWNKLELKSQRSLYKLYANKEIKNGILFAGSQGLWGYCYIDSDQCYARTKSKDFAYYDIALAAAFTAMNQMQIFAVGGKAVIERINDMPGASEENYASLFNKRQKSAVRAIAAAKEYLPFTPAYPRGQLALAVGSEGSVWRSLDGGYSFREEGSGTRNDLEHVIMLQNGARSAIASASEVLIDEHAHGQWRALSFKTKGFERAALRRIEFGPEQRILALDERCIFAENIEERALVAIYCSETPLKDMALLGDEMYILDAEQKLWRFTLESLLAALNKPELLKIDLSLEATAPGAASQLRACGETLYLLAEKQVFALEKGAFKALNSCASDVQALLCETTNAFCVKSDKIVNIQNKEQVSVNLPTGSLGFAAAKDGVFWAVGAAGVYRNSSSSHWSLRRSESIDLRAVKFSADAKIGVAVGDRGALYLSHDAGKTWIKQPNSERQSLRDICISQDGERALAVGDAGAILRAQRIAGRWTKLNMELNIDLSSCTFAQIDGEEQAIIAGKGGALYMTEDAKMSRFKLISSPSFEDIRSLATAQSGVVAVGGQKQDPSQICEDGFILIARQKPSDMRFWVILYALLTLFWLYTTYKIVQTLHTLSKKRPQSLA
ncbi:MAG: YCF48-related protein [Bradymonadales bacterium]